MKSYCGHPFASENCVLRCDDCEAERRKREDDALWNAAIEAAAQALENMSVPLPSRIRALRREAP